LTVGQARAGRAQVKEEPVTTSASDAAEAAQFLRHAGVSAAAKAIFDEDINEVGFVMNVSRLWAYMPEAIVALFELMHQVTSARPFTARERGILITACASASGNSYCSLAWGTKLAGLAGPELAAGILRGEDDGLTGPERAMAAWARRIARDPNGTSAADVAELRLAGFSDSDIFAMTVFVALRVAFSAVNDALGVRPDAEYRSQAPAAVLDAVTYGRPIDTGPPAGS
jgi:uncharacterized peroxidase-related enzyme